MNEFLSDADFPFANERRGFFPNVDISENEKSIFINMELPGLSKEDVTIKIKDDDMLVINGEKKKEVKTEDEKHSVIRVERSFGEFSRSFRLPDNANKESISAKFDNGVLHLVIEKKEPELPKEHLIDIQ
ncbi:MAG: hypothetical protein A2X64_02155 [Ignavibacteria bacterium GWF2_33_9]|nr:MAG: hypothetical protein A2X64_02155 [Ignavibacteria bacterium GWF2_33_9]